MRAHHRFLAVFAALGLLLAACGDDDSSDTSTDNGAEVDDSGDGDSSGGDGDSSDGNTGAEDYFAAGNCARTLQQWSLGFGQAFASLGSGGTDEVDYTEAAAQFEAYAEAAPSEIRADFQLFADVMGEFFEALADLDLQPGEVPTEEQAATFAELGEKFDDAEVEAATERIEQWFEDGC